MVMDRYFADPSVLRNCEFDGRYDLHLRRVTRSFVDALRGAPTLFFVRKVSPSTRVQCPPRGYHKGGARTAEIGESDVGGNAPLTDGAVLCPNSSTYIAFEDAVKVYRLYEDDDG